MVLNKRSTSRGGRVLRSVLAASFYGTVSIALTLINKTLFTTFSFADTRILGLGQIIAALIFLILFDRLKLIEIPALTVNLMKAIWPLSAAYVSMLVFGFAAMRGTNIVMFGTLRRTGIVLVLLMEYFLLSKSASLMVIASTIVMVTGVVTAGFSDLSYDLYGYIMAFFTNIATAIYIVLIKYFKKRLNMNAFGMLLYNAILSGPPLFLFSVIAGDFQNLMQFRELNNVTFWLVFCLSCLLGFTINYAVFVNTSVNSPLTQTVTGQLKDILVLIFGVLIFRDVKFSLLNTIGVCLSLSGSLVYAFAKFNEMQLKIPLSRSTSMSMKDETRYLLKVSHNV